MSTRRTTVVSLRTIGWLGVIALLVLPFTLLIGAPTRSASNTKSPDSEVIDLGSPGAHVGGTKWKAEFEKLRQELIPDYKPEDLEAPATQLSAI